MTIDDFHVYVQFGNRVWDLQLTGSTMSLQ